MDMDKYLKLARQAKAEGNSEDAKTYYNKVREEDPENGEAKFFYAYYALYEGKNAEIPSRFSNVCKVLPNSIKLIENSSLAKADKINAIEEIVNTFVPETWILNRYMNSKNRETKVGDNYVKVFEASSITSVCKAGMNAIKALGDQVEKVFPGDPECKRVAVIAWKEYVSLAQKWYAYAQKGDAEIYAEKIKLVDPSYEMPEKAGCISLLNKKD